MCYMPTIRTMDGTGLQLPKIIQEKSELLKDLIEDCQSNEDKKPLLLPDGTQVNQAHIDKFAKIYESGFTCNQLSVQELTTCAHLHDHFQMSLPVGNLESALYAKIKQNQCSPKKLERLGSDWHNRIAHQFIKNSRLDAQLLQPYSDCILANPTNISNEREHSVENLLFASDTKKIYGAYDLPRFAVVKLEPHLQLLSIKNSDNITLKEIPLIHGHYPGQITIHSNGSYALAKHYDDNDFSRNFFDLIDLTTGNIHDLQKIFPTINPQDYRACCFYKDNLYIADNADKTITIKSVALANQQEETVVHLENPEAHKIIDIAVDKHGKTIAIATDKTIHIINTTNVHHKVEPITHDLLSNNEKLTIKKISLNNNGSLLCIVIGNNWLEYDCYAQVYLYNINQQKAPWIEISQKLAGNLALPDDARKWPVHLQKFRLTDIDSISWNTDDSLLCLECNYRHLCFNTDDTFAKSTYVGRQYAFINPLTCHGWSENDIHRDRSLINSGGEDETIITAQSILGSQTKARKWCDQNIKDTLQYLNPHKRTTYSSDKRLFGIMLLCKIIEQSGNFTQLNDDETTVYDNNIPDPIKTILKQAKTVLPFQTPWYQALPKKLSCYLSSFKNQLVTLSHQYPKSCFFLFGGTLLLIVKQTQWAHYF